MDGHYEMINRCMAKLDTLLTANMKWTIETNFLQVKLLLLKVKRRSEIDPPRVTEEFAQMLNLLEVLEEEPDVLVRFSRISEQLKRISECLQGV